MTRKLVDFKVPMDEHGNLIMDPHIIDYHWDWEIPHPDKVTWKDNIPFIDTMRVGPVENEHSYHGSKTSTFCEATSMSTGKSYPIYVSDLALLIKESVLDHGLVTGTWAFSRHSGKISLYLASP